MLHWTILIGAHIFVFWYIPIRGNFTLYGKPTCDEEQEQFYGCKDFHKNNQLRNFYIMIVIYLCISASQLSYGFPIFKKPSSIMQYYGPIPNIGALLFAAVPFAIEMRCVFDFTCSKTSLDVFQFWQLWQYHMELYNAKNSNEYYLTKQLGIRTEFLEKCLTGCLISSILLFLLVGPLMLFSQFGPLTAKNPVLSSDMDIQFLMNKTIYSNETTGLMIPGVNFT